MNDGMLFDRGVRPSSADIIKSLISSCMRTKFVLFVCMVSFVFPLFLSGKCKRGNLQIRVKETFTRDFVHDVSIFDVCYPVYRRTAECLLNGSSYTAHDGWLKDVDNPDDSTFVQSGMRRYLFDARREIYTVCEAFHRLQSDTAYNEEAEKARLVRQIEAFRDTAVVLPSIYVLIDNEFGGSVERYVDALFSNSALTDRATMRRVCGKPTIERMQRDMGFQFVVSKLMYRAWEKQNRPVADGTRLVVLRSELERR